MAENNNTLLEKLDGLVARFEEVSTLITDPNVIADQKRYVKLTKEYKDLNDIMKARREYIQCLNGLEEAKQIMTNESDPEMKEMAREEANLCEVRIPVLEEEIKLLFWKYAVVREVMKPPFLQVTCSVCTPNTARQKVGNWKYPAPMKEQQEVLRKLSAP